MLDRKTYSLGELLVIFHKTAGDCHHCHGKMKLESYGDYWSPVGWEVDHYVARDNGGSDSLGNLYAAHAHCNRAKGTMSADEYRAKIGRFGLPLSSESWKHLRRRAIEAAKNVGG